METEDIVNKRREKILSRSPIKEDEPFQSLPKQLASNTEEVKVSDKLKIVQKIESIQNQSAKQRLLIALVSGLLAAAFNIFLKLNLQFILMWVTLYAIILGYYFSRIRHLKKKSILGISHFFLTVLTSQRDDLVKEIQQLIPSKHVAKLVASSEIVLQLMQEFQKLVEGLVLFLWTFLFIHMVYYRKKQQHQQ